MTFLGHPSKLKYNLFAVLFHFATVLDERRNSKKERWTSSGKLPHYLYSTWIDRNQLLKRPSDKRFYLEQVGRDLPRFTDLTFGLNECQLVFGTKFGTLHYLNLLQYPPSTAFPDSPENNLVHAQMRKVKSWWRGHACDELRIISSNDELGCSLWTVKLFELYLWNNRHAWTVHICEIIDKKFVKEKELKWINDCESKEVKLWWKIGCRIYFIYFFLKQLQH